MTNRHDLIEILSKITPTEGEWSSVKDVDFPFITIGDCSLDTDYLMNDDIDLITLAPQMRIEILDMAKEIEELKEERNRLGKGIEDIINGDSHRPTLEIIEILKMVHTPIGEFYCQRDIEGKSKCDNTCDHCNEYYKPLKNQ